MSAQPGPDPKQWAEAVRWLARADDDLRVVEVLIAQANPPLLPAASHCQQAAEKMAKAVLIASQIAPPRIHDLEKLALLVGAQHADIGQALLGLAEITIWFVAARYPDTFEIIPTVQDISSVLEKLKKLRQRIQLLAPKP
jgi:HEPN domain-containing protein